MSLDPATLLQDGFLAPGSFDSPFDDDGIGDDYWMRSEPFDTAIQPPTGPMIVMYDMEMYAAHDQVAVGFSDGTSDVIQISAFERLLRNPTNAQTDFQLPVRANK